MPVETVGAAKLFSIIFGPLLAILAAAFGFMWKRQSTHIEDSNRLISDLRTEVYRDYTSKEYLEMYVTLTIKPVVDSVEKLAESNKELAQELREFRKKQ